MPKIRYKMPKTRTAAPLTFDVRLAAPPRRSRKRAPRRVRMPEMIVKTTTTVTDPGRRMVL
jgi:hypothetical protein